jgi:hypothetical protein
MAIKKIPVNRYPPYLLARQIAALKKIADDSGTLVQFHIRTAVDEYLARQKGRRKKPAR